MKTNDLLLVGAAVVAGYFLLKPKQDDGATSGGFGAYVSPAGVPRQWETQPQARIDLPTVQAPQPIQNAQTGGTYNQPNPYGPSVVGGASLVGQATGQLPSYAGQSVLNLATGNINTGLAVKESDIFTKTYTREAGKTYETVTGPTGPLYTITRK